MSLNSLGLLSGLASAGSGSSGNVTQVAKQLASVIDTNHDGQVSTDEFATFLTQILGAMNTPSALAAKAGGTSADGSALPLESQISPDRWTDNNAPYGVTFAGFSPQNHTELTLADLKLAKNAKYTAYDYLLSNRVAPDASWAPIAAEALNKQTGSTLFHAIDGETLGYGDEFIHSAANGRGMPTGTYNPTAVGEFLWGADSSLA